MKNVKKLFPVLVLGLILLLAACGGEDDQADSGDGNEAEEEKGSISIGMNNWAENVAVSNMWKIVLEEKGYDVSLEPVEKAILYEGLANQDLDIGMEVWLPNTDKSFYNEYEEEIDWRENWYEGTDLALVVPSYMEDINSIEDLNANKEKFESQIYGIDPGSSLMGLTEEVVAEYNLDYELVPSSEPSMMAELDNRMSSEEPVVVTLWKPHWAFAEMDLKILEDPKNIYGDSENILYAARLGLEDEHPEIVEWFDNFMLNDDQLGSLMAELNEAESEEEGAQNWIDDNRDLIEEWTGGSE
ncbi:glycine/betaine ABC transporter [Halalkalibacillus sediminis]|uniref:Glycine/betaine ABC transporter n=1 Tax=Halalkalibacillus sediminis TaxID=2018042 RepID=A0A2I0QS35_9BACI|nr:glycine betaine ABC transporter substrate-binding protein [Halalkalibacillus sediminis]PKR77128.1 glycine/betaine ABC transporter [Halalkalibacillus sediminis]